ncbi:hypothetical protein [Photobacterium angustum]|uniref:YbbD head domain-containing protein n=1 Tax=Photobacterium angustum TaxID=661 RepID=A0ABX5H184_PHOAN|nr:hypothetical protein [Photobacterium angustum]PSX06373.1 hypothetical protein C0W27_16765 [Photobacterium angustum]
MRKILKVILSIVVTTALLLSILILIFLNSVSSVVSEHYLTYNSAKEDNFFERGWLPDILLESTLMIIVNNDVSSNTSHGVFYINNKDMNEFIDKLQITEDKNKYKYISEYNSVWYFNINDNGKVIYSLN